MNAEIVAIGTELLLGQSRDTNSSWLAGELARLGVDLFGFQAVGDNEKRLEAALKGALDRAAVVLTTGGLGPTVDDVTRKVAGRIARRQLVFHEDIAKALEDRFTRLRPGKPFPKVNLNQAFIPQGALVIPNPVGTAPGFIVKADKSHLICLPGVPAEMKAMFEATVKPFLKSLAPGGALIKSRVYRTTGLFESALNERIADLFENSTNPTIGVLAHLEGVDIRLTAKADTEAQADALLDGLSKALTLRLPTHLYGLDQDGLETIVGKILTTRSLTLATAESCTGGLIAHRVTLVPGSSRYFLRGAVVYSNEAKTDLFQVDPKLIEAKGAVSAEVAEVLARQCRLRAGADLGLSTTGIAGPTGGSAEKPVGLVFIALADEQSVQVFRHQFSGDRAEVKFRASQAALELVRRYCLGLPLRDGDEVR
ncbi:MAG TPA: competence/damage-inducible protein A [bacterium]|nr:competence/damage-inducible protein A [bacterium]